MILLNSPASCCPFFFFFFDVGVFSVSKLQEQFCHLFYFPGNRKTIMVKKLR